MTDIISIADFAAVILAAGNSLRMGVPKYRLLYQGENTFLGNIVMQFSKAGCNQIIVVLNEDGYNDVHNNPQYKFPENTKSVINFYPERDRFFSIQTGLRSITGNMPVFIANVDNPFINIPTLFDLFNEVEKADFVYPEYKGKGGHPVLLSAKLVNEIASQQEYHWNFKSFCSNYTTKALSVNDAKVLLNINNYDDYKNNFII